MNKISISLLLILSTSAQAYDYGSIKGSLEKKIEEAKEAAKRNAGRLPSVPSLPKLPKLPEPRVPDQETSSAKILKTSESKLTIVEKVPADDKFIMFRIARTDQPEKEEVLLYPAKNGEVRAQLYFRKGAGRYTVKMFENKTAEKYTSYSWLKMYDAENFDTRDMDFLLPSQAVQSDNATLVAIAKEVTKDAVDEADAAKKLHDFIVKDIDYDTSAYKDKSYLTKPYDALTVSSTKSAICMGYANYLAALGRAIGLRTRVVYGKAKVAEGWLDHAWNEVLVNDEWKIIDSTWDDPIRYTYFFPTAQQFSVDHTKETNNPEI